MNGHEHQRMFWFRGSTMAVGGRIESPVCETIDAQGACVLPPTGGFASASVEKFSHRNIIGFDRVSSTVSGQKVRHGKQTAGETLVTVAIEGLNVLNVVTADRVVARMSSMHVREDDEASSRSEILPFGSHFENLRIGGVPIDLKPYPELVERGDHEALIRPCADRSFPWIDANGVPIREDDAGGEAQSDLQRRGSVPDRPRLAPLFRLGKDGAAVPPGCSMRGEHGIRIPGFGVVYFGEYLVTRASRRLTMMRIELGCPITGSIVCGNVDSNGHWDP
ncbi:MAG: hypothetical protein ACOY82_06005 [Pseudomonadota bacterium]